jgi:hypothetical protein
MNSKLKNIQLFFWDGIGVRPINWAGWTAHPTQDWIIYLLEIPYSSGECQLTNKEAAQ